MAQTWHWALLSWAKNLSAEANHKHERLRFDAPASPHWLTLARRVSLGRRPHRLRALRPGGTLIEQAVKAADASTSNRRIARMLGVDEKTVRNDSAHAPENASENNGEETVSAA
jgi:hypothetical protein